MWHFKVVVDDGTLDYLDQYRASRGDQDPIQAQLRLDAAKSQLATVLRDLTHPTEAVQTHDLSKVDADGDTSMQNQDGAVEAEVVTIPLTVDDELSDIPAEMRETVAKEITAFRDRSNRRDMERLRREEEIEAQERQRNNQPRPSRLASPPLASPTNGVPSGPKDKAIPNAPLGPKGYQTNGPKSVAFVSGVNGVPPEDDDTDASDEELERRRTASAAAEAEEAFLAQERRWLNRERSRAAALERERARDRDEARARAAARDVAAARLRTLDETAEAGRRGDDYHHDRGAWTRARATFRAREAQADDADRAQAERERARAAGRPPRDDRPAPDRPAPDPRELPTATTAAAAGAPAPREPARFKLSLGAAAQQKAAQQEAARAATRGARSLADVEGLLEDEADAAAGAKRTLIPIAPEAGGAGAPGATMTDEERQQAARQLAADIPSDKDGLWDWNMQWDFVDEAVLTEQLRPFVEKKIVEYLGVQEQLLVEVVEEHIRKRGPPQELVEQLEGVRTPTLAAFCAFVDRCAGARRRGRGLGTQALAYAGVLLGGMLTIWYYTS